MALTLVTPPSIEPVTVAEAKTNSRITGSDDDTYIGLLIEAAKDHVENYTKRSLITQTWDWTIDGGLRNVSIPKAPLQSITSIKYIDNTGSESTLSTSIYKVDASSESGRIVLAYDQSWPTARHEINNVTIRLVCGYGDAATDIPEAVRFAILWLVDHWYEHRSSVSEITLTETPISLTNVLWPYRVDFF